MDTGSGKLYQGQKDEYDRLAAIAAGRTIVPVSPQVAEIVAAGHDVLNRAERRRQAREERRAAKRGSHS